MAEIVTNYFRDPDFRSTRGTSNYIAANAFPNPTPTVDLTHWAAVPGGSITRLAAAALFPENSHGCRVVNGVTLTGANTNSSSQDWTFTGKIKAQTAMTITLTGAMLDAGQTFAFRTVGWGDFGWGETTSYLDGPVKTFAAGEECLFRAYCGEQSNIIGPNHQVLLTISGTGTFDLDGIVQWIGVDDGAGDDPPGWGEIPNAPLYFCGDTPADDNFTYSWYGDPHNSPSLQHAALPKYAWGTYPWVYSDELPVVADWVFQHETAGGEHRLASRSPIMFGHQNTILAENAAEAGVNDDTAGITSLQPNTSYVVVGDYITDYQVYHSGYPEPQWACNAYLIVRDGDPALTYPANYLGYLPLNGFPPYRLPFMAPFTTGANSIIQIALDTSQNWVTSDLYMTNIGIFEIPTPLHTYDGLDNPVDGSQTWDLTAMGVEAGKSYHCNAEMWEPNGQPIIESRVGAGAWTTLAESTLPITEEPIMLLGEYFDFDVPADATEVRFRLQNPAGNGVGTFDLFEQPPAFFTGDTPDGGGYYYWWTGDAHDSASVRSDVPPSGLPPINARMWIDGEAKNVEEIRISTAGGTLVTLTEIGVSDA